MATAKVFRVLVATDGSNHARAAIATAAQFPWPTRTRIRVVVAQKTLAQHQESIVLTALARKARSTAESARRALSRVWPDVDVVVTDKEPVRSILAEAERFSADAIVLGWRGHGPVRRLVMGSVSRGVVRGATCSVLVVRRRQRVKRVVVGLDGSPNAQSAMAFVKSLRPPQDGRVTLATAIQLVPAASRRLIAAMVADEVQRANAIRTKAATRQHERAAAALERRGWQTRKVLSTGAPLRDLLRTVAKERAQLLVIGARRTSGLRRLLLGSVAEGALSGAPVPVVIARGDSR